MYTIWRLTTIFLLRSTQFLSLLKLLVVIAVSTSCICWSQKTVGAPPVIRSRAAQAYLDLIENFIGFAEQHWNEKAESYDAKGSGVTWARGNGGVCLAAAVLLTEYPDHETFSPKKVDRKVLLDHVRRTIRTLCLTS